MMRLMISALLLTLIPHVAMAQDVPGIEICTAEKTMERRTGCLQSNVNFLKSSLTKASLDSQQKIDAANRQIDALKATVIGLQNTVTQLQGQVQALGKQPNGAPKDAPKAPAAK
jgi:outer membrane murein-binding lipoprotein Lpp